MRFPNAYDRTSQTHLESKVHQSVGDTGQGLVPATGLDDDADRGGRLTEIDTGDLDTCRVCDGRGVRPGRTVDDGAEGLRTGKHRARFRFFLLGKRGGGGKRRSEEGQKRSVFLFEGGRLSI